MKGRGKVADLEVCRVWACPACGRKARTAGAVVNLACTCGDEEVPPRQVWMHLVEDRPRHRPLSVLPPAGAPPDEVP